MSMLRAQACELREAARQFEGYQNGEISRMLRKAADTIISLRNRLQELQGEVNHWRTEQIHAYGNWEDAYKRVIELEANNGTRWHELFGSPEKAARTLQEFDPSQRCRNCMFREDCTPVKGPCYYESQDALLEWLRGDA